MNKNNPAYKLAVGNIEAAAKDIVENGGLGTNARRFISEAARAIIDATFLYNESGRQLQGTGARINVLEYTTRRGWTDLDKNDWNEFGSNQALSFLTENLIVDKQIETSMEWNEWDIKDTEKGVEKIKSMLMAALMEELPVEYEKRYINLWKDIILNGKELRSDDVLGNGATYPTATGREVVVDTSDEAATQETIKKIVRLHNKMGKVENPIIYKPGKNKFYYIMNTELATEINFVGGFDKFYSEEAWERALNNEAFALLNGSKVLVSNELPEDIPFLLIPTPGAFENIEIMYTTLPTEFKSDIIRQGESVSNKMLKIESGYFSMQASYWAIKFGLLAFGTMGANSYGAPKAVNIHFESSDSSNGATIAKYSLDATNTSLTTTDFTIWLVDHNFIEKNVGGTMVINGAETELDLGNLNTGSYMLQIRDADGFNIETSATFYVRNKNHITGTNKEVSGTVSTDTQKAEVDFKEDTKSLKQDTKEKAKETIADEVAKKVEDAKEKAKETK